MDRSRPVQNLFASAWATTTSTPMLDGVHFAFAAEAMEVVGTARSLATTVHGMVAVVVTSIVPLLVALQLPDGVTHEVLHSAIAPISLQPALHCGVGHVVVVVVVVAAVVEGVVVVPLRELAGITLLLDRSLLLMSTSQAMAKAAIPTAPAWIGVSLRFAAWACANAMTTFIARTASAAVHGKAWGWRTRSS